MAYSVRACLLKSRVISSSSPGIAQRGWVFAWLKLAIETPEYCEYMNYDNNKVKSNFALNYDEKKTFSDTNVKNWWTCIIHWSFISRKIMNRRCQSSTPAPIQLGPKLPVSMVILLVLWPRYSGKVGQHHHFVTGCPLGICYRGWNTYPCMLVHFW